MEKTIYKLFKKFAHDYTYAFYMNTQRAKLNAALRAKHSGYDTAELILKIALAGQTLRSGKDKIEHSLHLARLAHLTDKQKIIALLHDVVEDSRKNPPWNRWTIEDLRDIGFDPDIVDAVKALTRLPDENNQKIPYFDFIQRIALSGKDAVTVKLADLQHNSQNERYAHIFSEKDCSRINKYNVSYYYLKAVKNGDIDPEETDVIAFMKQDSFYAQHPEICQDLAVEFGGASPDAEPAPAPLPSQKRIAETHTTKDMSDIQDRMSEFKRFNPVKFCLENPTPPKNDAHLDDIKDILDSVNIPYLMTEEDADFLTYINVCYYYMAAVWGTAGKMDSDVPRINPGTPLIDFADQLLDGHKNKARLQEILNQFPDRQQSPQNPVLTP